MNDANGKQLKSTKRQKFERKQQQKQDQIERERYYDEFVERNSNSCHMISDDWCKEIVDDTSQESFVQGLVKPYLNLKENTSNNNRSNRLFILEGAESVRVLIQQAAATIKHRWKINDKGKSICSTGDFVGVELVSILVKPATFWEEPVCLLKDVEQSAVDLQAHREINNHGTYGQGLNIPYDVLIGKESTLSSIAGFHIARGALACGKVPEYLNEEWLKAYLQKLTSDKNRRSLRLLALDGICDTANMGSMIRTSKAFDVDAILLSSNCCNPWSRRSVRGKLQLISRDILCYIPLGNLFLYYRLKCPWDTFVQFL